MSENTSVKKTYARSTPTGQSNVVKHANVPHRRSFLRAFSKTLESFCKESTFHGLRNLYNSARGLRNKNISRSKRVSKLVGTLLWLTACGLGVSFAIVLILLVWNRFQSTPTITTIETNNYPIWNVPFPAVTLCNINKVYGPATANITEKLISRGLSDEVVHQFFSNLSKLVQSEYVDDIYAQTLANLTELNYTTEKLMFEIMQPCSVMLQNCIWLGQLVPCDTIFRVAKSSEGFCCSFNYNALRENLEVNSETNTVFQQLNDPVHRVSGAGQFVSLELLLHVSMAQYVSYTRSYYGISVLIHSSEDYPQASATTTVAQPGCDVVLAIIPSVVVSEPTVRGLTLKQRLCYFEDEQDKDASVEYIYGLLMELFLRDSFVLLMKCIAFRDRQNKKLRTTEKYSFQSCITECAVDTIVKQCGCLPFYYSEVHITDFEKRTRQCDLKDAGCLRDNRHIFSSLQPEAVTNETLGMNCPHCLPSCSEERYGVQSIIAKRFDGDNLTSMHYSGTNLSNHVTLKVHFKDVTCLKYRRDIFMTWDGFLGRYGKPEKQRLFEYNQNWEILLKIDVLSEHASFGGIFGLCLGGSLISFIEIFYFFSLKLYSSYYGMDDTVEPPKVDYRKQDNQINIVHVSPYPIDDTLTMRFERKHKSTIDAFHANANGKIVSYDQYLD